MKQTPRTLTGDNLIAGSESSQGNSTFQAIDPTFGARLPTVFTEATASEILAATAAARSAFVVYREWSGHQVAELLHACSNELLDLGDQLLATAQKETGLPEARLIGERARTCAQIEMFAELVASGEHLDAIIDHADPNATPPRPDLRRMKIPVGPVAVFGASNFPLAFSVPGGDTASALAAGCPVVIKAHASHPATSELCARALLAAADRTGAPPGLISVVHGPSNEIGRALVLADEIRSVGFTGSTRGGLALHKLATSRAHPIPVHAEMGSINPVLVTARALEARGDDIATGFVSSLTMGVGQFCTKPGLMFIPEGRPGDQVVASIERELTDISSAPLLNQRIRYGLSEQLRATMAQEGVRTLVDGEASESDGSYCSPSLLSVDLDTFIAQPALRDEHFGPVSLVVRCPGEPWERIIDHLDGQLTLTLQAETGDAAALRPIREHLAERAGRIVWNGFPTGVAVTAAQHHGGPHPATSDVRFTSVGTTAIDRFLRPVAYQDMPEELLPDALHDANPLGVPQRVDGSWPA